MPPSVGTGCAIGPLKAQHHGKVSGRFGAYLLVSSEYSVHTQAQTQVTAQNVRRARVRREDQLLTKFFALLPLHVKQSTRLARLLRWKVRERMHPKQAQTRSVAERTFFASITASRRRTNV